MTVEQLASELVGRGHQYPHSGLLKQGEWGLVVLEAFDHATGSVAVIDAELRAEARRLLVDVPDAPEYADEIAEAIAIMDRAVSA